MLEAQVFAQRPGLEGAAAGGEGRVGVGDFGDVPQAGGVEMGFQRRQEFFAGLFFGFGGSAADADPGFDEGADEPGPDGALMVGGVALVQRADVVRNVAGGAGGERAQAQVGEQMVFRRRRRFCALCRR